MYKGKKILGLVPARGGSKGLPRKNIKPLLGKPLIVWTIEQALQSRYLDTVVVSTEDDEIAEIAVQYGARVPFKRPSYLSNDDADGIGLIFHALSELEHYSEVYDVVVDLQPTSPLRTSDDIDNVIEMLFEKKADAIVSVSPVEHHPYLSNTLPPDGSMKDFLMNDMTNRNRQTLPAHYRTNGAIYAAFRDYLVQNRDFFGDSTYSYVMPRERSVDIDDILDLYLAELILQRRTVINENTVSSLR